MSGAKFGFELKSEVICTGPDGKVKWRDGTSTHLTQEEFAQRFGSMERAEEILKPQVILVGEGHSPCQ